MKIPPVVNVSQNIITKAFVKNGYKTSANGTLTRTLTKAERKTLNKQYGFMGGIFFKKIFSQTVTNDTIKDFGYFVNSGKEAGKRLLETSFGTLFGTYMILKNSRCSDDFATKSTQNKDTFKLIENLAQNEIDKKTFKSISKYKGKACTGTGFEIQDALRKHPHKISKRLQKHIDNISNYIDKQIVPESLKLYRGEGCHTNLINAKVKNGEKINLGHMMFLAANSNDDNEILKMKEFVLDNEITVKMPAFTSTSLTENIALDFKDNYIFNDKVVWKLDVAPNTKGTFVEGLYTNGHFKEQNEVLLQKGSQIKIKDLDFDKEEGCWMINGVVSN
ncbi:hypothetical protein IJ732_07430 [bacterium]|nr:hypothetical protein [bacterium]